MITHYITQTPLAPGILPVPVCQLRYQCFQVPLVALPKSVVSLALNEGDCTCYRLPCCEDGKENIFGPLLRPCVKATVVHTEQMLVRRTWKNT